MVSDPLGDDMVEDTPSLDIIQDTLSEDIIHNPPNKYIIQVFDPKQGPHALRTSFFNEKTHRFYVFHTRLFSFPPSPTSPTPEIVDWHFLQCVYQLFGTPSVPKETLYTPVSTERSSASNSQRLGSGATGAGRNGNNAVKNTSRKGTQSSSNGGGSSQSRGDGKASDEILGEADSLLGSDKVPDIDGENWKRASHQIYPSHAADKIVREGLSHYHAESQRLKIHRWVEEVAEASRKWKREDEEAKIDAEKIDWMAEAIGGMCDGEA